MDSVSDSGISSIDGRYFQKVPDNLRCVCGELLDGAVRMPCCGKYICGTDMADLLMDPECPVCFKQVEDFRLIKEARSIRHKVKVFLEAEERLEPRTRKIPLQSGTKSSQASVKGLDQQQPTAADVNTSAQTSLIVKPAEFRQEIVGRQRVLIALLLSSIILTLVAYSVPKEVLISATQEGHRLVRQCLGMALHILWKYVKLAVLGFRLGGKVEMT